MIHQVLTHTWQLHLAVDVELRELLTGSNAGSHENRRATVCTSGDNHLLSRDEGQARSISLPGNYTRSPQTLRPLFQHDAIHGGVGLDRHIAPVVVVGDEIRRGGPDSLVNRTRNMATAVRDVSGAEHVVVERQTL